MGVTYHDWQRDKPGPPHSYASPNLIALRDHMRSRWVCLYWGIYSAWWNASGTSNSPSSHMFGAALDWRYVPADGPETIQWLIDNFEALGVQMVIDYKNRRIWKVGRGWKAHPSLSGGGDTRLHIETCLEMWADSTPIDYRLDDDMILMIQPLKSTCVLTLNADGTCRWVKDGNLQAALMADKLVKPTQRVQKLSLKQFVLVGPAPAAAPTPLDPENILPTDFAAWKPSA